jgi:oligopeptide/dipeptide ABC transporter ATP-binding protein
MPLLAIQDLKTYFYTEDGISRAVDGVSFEIEAGSAFGLVGESGCGKSVTSLSIMNLIPQPPGKIVGGKILFEGENLLEKNASEMRKIRGNEIAMIFQEPMTSLNPVFTVGNQIIEAIMLHQSLDNVEAREKAIDMLRLVGIPSPQHRIDDYPHQLSGGMRQRVMIAMALSCNPRLLIADEPTTALDVTVQAQILELMRGLQAEFGASILLITHDLGVIAELADEVGVMYAGKIVERADVKSLFADPKHPYTVGLLGSIPRLSEEQDRLSVIEGTVPNPIAMPSGCRFHPRCRWAKAICQEYEPPEIEINCSHKASCWRLLDYKRTQEVG